MQALAADWLSGLPSQLGHIQHALDRKDFLEVAQRAHAIKGTSGSVGLPAFVGPATSLNESATAEQHAEACEHLDVLFHLLDPSLQRRQAAWPCGMRVR